MHEDIICITTLKHTVWSTLCSQSLPFSFSNNNKARPWLTPSWLLFISTFRGFPSSSSFLVDLVYDKSPFWIWTPFSSHTTLPTQFPPLFHYFPPHRSLIMCGLELSTILIDVSLWLDQRHHRCLFKNWCECYHVSQLQYNTHCSCW